MVTNEDGKATQAMCKWIGNEYFVKSSSCIFVKKSPMRDFNKNREYFFYFVSWISLSCLEILYGIHQYFDIKNVKTLGGIHVTRKSKNWNLRYSAPRTFRKWKVHEIEIRVKIYLPLNGVLTQEVTFYNLLRE